MFTDKKVSHPMKHHQVPSKCWESVAVDLLAPIPSSKHVVVVQDLTSQYPSAKIVQSTKVEKVLPALSEIYDTYGNPRNQLSDNGPSFNSKAMEQFTQKRDINLEKTPPLHPQSNPVETFMKPLGKTMKIAYNNKHSETDALKMLLQNYQSTPHLATEVTPADMLFRNGLCTSFPRKEVLEKQIQLAGQRDKQLKQEREVEKNSSKY